jgi:hypothetical protein
VQFNSNRIDLLVHGTCSVLLSIVPEISTPTLAVVDQFISNEKFDQSQQPRE